MINLERPLAATKFEIRNPNIEIRNSFRNTLVFWKIQGDIKNTIAPLGVICL